MEKELQHESVVEGVEIPYFPPPQEGYKRSLREDIDIENLPKLGDALGFCGHMKPKFTKIEKDKEINRNNFIEQYLDFYSKLDDKEKKRFLNGGYTDKLKHWNMETDYAKDIVTTIQGSQSSFGSLVSGNGAVYYKQDKYGNGPTEEMMRSTLHDVCEMAEYLKAAKMMSQKTGEDWFNTFLKIENVDYQLKQIRISVAYKNMQNLAKENEVQPVDMEDMIK